MTPEQSAQLNEGFSRALAAMRPTLERLGEALIELFQCFAAAGQQLAEFFYRMAWQRQDGESLVAWGKRLEGMGLMDNPDIRWEYQKAVLQTIAGFFLKPVRLVIQLIHRRLSP